MMDPLSSPSTAMLVGIWLGIAAFLMGFVNQALKFFDRFKESPPTHEKYATKVELQKVETRVDEVEREVRGEITALRETITANYNKIMESSADGRRRLYLKIDDISTAIARLEGKLEKR